MLAPATSKNRKAKRSINFAANDEATYAGLSILAEYRELGATFNGDDFRSNGYIECYGFIRSDGTIDSRPSARVRDNGQYADSGTGGREINIWDVAAKLRGTTWQEEKKRYTDKAGTTHLYGGKDGKRSATTNATSPASGSARPPAKPKRRKPAENPSEVLRFEEWTDGRRRIVDIWIAKHKPGLTVAAIEANGGRVGVYIVGKEKKYEIRVLALPIYGQPLDESGEPIVFDSSQALAAAMLAIGPTAYGIWSLNPHEANGTPLKSKNRETGEWHIIKMKTVGLADGVYGKHGLELIAAGASTSATWKVEGPTDLVALSAAAIAAGLAGEVVILSTGGGAGSFNPWMASLFSTSAESNVVGDDDEAGQEGVDKASSVLFNAGLSPIRRSLGYPLKPKHGNDVRDYFNGVNVDGTAGQGRTFAEFQSISREPWSDEKNAAVSVVTDNTDADDQGDEPAGDEGEESDKPTIIIDVDEERVTDEAIAALANRSDLFQRGGILVQPIANASPPRGVIESAPRLRISPVTAPRLREMSAATADWKNLKLDKETEELVEVPAHPPQWCINQIDARGQWRGIPPIAAIVDCPMFGPDGSIIDQPGYDPKTGLYLALQREFPPVPDQPTEEEAKAAAKILYLIIEDFPFIDDAEDHKAAWLAMLLSCFARFAYHGPTPMLTIDGSTQGSGKSYVGDTIGLTFTGDNMDRWSVPSNDDEFRKRITSLALAGQPLVLLDNFDGHLNFPSLDAALTATTWSDRLLTTNKTFSGPLDTIWFLTGNNVSMTADSVRRSLYVRLEPKEERPEDRTKFKYPDLRAEIRANRPLLVQSALTILRHYHVVGRPKCVDTAFGSFEGWSDLVRQAVMTVTDHDPIASRSSLKESVDVETAILKRLMRQWLEAAPNGSRVAAMLTRVAPRPYDNRSAEDRELHDTIIEFHQGKNGDLPTPKGLGSKLRRLRHKIVGELMFDVSEDDKDGHIWRVVKVAK